MAVDSNVGEEFGSNHIAPRESQPIVFVHIFKAAGTTFQTQIRDALGESSAPQINDGKLTTGETFFERITGACAKPETKLICGHARYARFAAAYKSSGLSSPTAISFVRNPVDRYVSMYNYFCAVESEKWHNQAISMSIGKFLHFLIENDRESILNHQCAYLSANGEANFEAARDNIRNCFLFFGPIRNIGSVNSVLRKYIGVSINNSKYMNVSPKNAKKDDLSQSDYDVLIDITSEDKKLFDFARNMEPTG